MITDHQSIRNNYDRLSRWYNLISGSSERLARTRGLEALDVQLGEQVLEIGCGTGESLVILTSRVGHTGHIYGLDLSSGMLDVAKSKLGKSSLLDATLLQGDAFCIPIANETMDAVFTSFTLELFPSKEISVILQECKRILHPGGRLCTVVLLQKGKPNWMEKLYILAHHQWPLIIDCRPIPVTDMLQSAGFKVSKMSEMSIWGLAVGIVVATFSQN